MKLKSKLPAEGVTIFAQMSQLARQLGAINLGQGFPDFPPSDELLRYIHEALKTSTHQYAPMPGVELLRAMLAEKIRHFYNVQVDTDAEITVTAGATEAIFVAITAFVHPDEEVILLDPSYDSYRPSILFNSAVPRPVSGIPPLFRPDFNHLQDAITDKTRMIIVNTPNNPGTHVWTRQDWDNLYEIVKNWDDIVILSDEVYEHIVFDSRQHVSVLQHPELRHRAIAVYSFGKTFHATGWKIGYAVGSADLMREFRKVHQYVVYAVNTPFQEGLARYLEDLHRRSQWSQLDASAFFQQKRNLLFAGLQRTPLKPILPEGTYFMLADYSALSQADDRTFAIEFAQQYGIVTIPLSPMWAGTMPPNLRMVRFCFAKRDETLQQALEKLQAL